MLFWGSVGIQLASCEAGLRSPSAAMRGLRVACGPDVAWPMETMTRRGGGALNSSSPAVENQMDKKRTWETTWKLGI